MCRYFFAILSTSLGNVAENPIDEIFYENRGRLINIITDQGSKDITDVNRVQVKAAFGFIKKVDKFNYTTLMKNTAPL